MEKHIPQTRRLVIVTVIDKSRSVEERYLPHTQRKRAIPADLIKFVDDRLVPIEGGKNADGMVIALTTGEQFTALGSFEELVNGVDTTAVLAE